MSAAAQAALRALLEREGRVAVCRSFVQTLVDEGYLGASVILPGEPPVEVGVSGGRRFPVEEVDAALTLCSRPPIQEEEGEALARLLGLVLALEAREDAQREERARRVRTLVHDVRSLLAVMLGHAEILESGLGGSLTERQLKSVVSIRRQVGRCEALLAERRQSLVDHETSP